MFELTTTRLRPAGWPAELEVRELIADDVLPLFMNGRPQPDQAQKIMVHLATFTLEGERVFATPEAVGQVPARLLRGLTEIMAAVMRLNMPEVADDTERPT